MNIHKLLACNDIAIEQSEMAQKCRVILHAAAMGGGKK